MKQNIFKNRPKLYQYPLLSNEDREVVDDTITNHLKSNPILRLRFSNRKPKKDDLWMLSWSDILEIRSALTENDLTRFFKILYGLNELQTSRLDIFNCFSAHRWAIEQLKQIQDAEIERLVDEPTDEEKEAGVEELQEYGHFPALDGLAKGNALDYDKWLRLPYAVIFKKLAKDKLTAEINKRYNDIISRKNKANS